MSTITLTSAKPASGGLSKMFARVGQAWADRRSAAALAGMSERELQDVGWGQTDRWSPALQAGETPPERKARAVAVAAWYGTTKKAA
jgi:uncharacterized protein YjiS (DUF1127 family)